MMRGGHLTCCLSYQIHILYKVTREYRASAKYEQQSVMLEFIYVPLLCVVMCCVQPSGFLCWYVLSDYTVYFSLDCCHEFSLGIYLGRHKNQHICPEGNLYTTEFSSRSGTKSCKFFFIDLVQSFLFGQSWALFLALLQPLRFCVTPSLAWNMAAHFVNTL